MKIESGKYYIVRGRVSGVFFGKIARQEGTSRTKLKVDYGSGWEHDLDEYSLSEIKKTRKEYRENCPQYPVRVVKGREKIEETKNEI